jgi:CheY-like chemotaxis protein
LIIGDDEDLSGFLSEGLTLGGFWTSVIASGIQALEVFRLRTFDLVLIDAALKGLGPTELTRRLRRPNLENAPRTDIPLFVIAGSLDEIDPQDAADAGADGVLLPPIELEELIPMLFHIVYAWRSKHPGRPWADEAAQAKN